MTKYNESDIIPGTRKVLKNNMVAGKILIGGNEVFRIIKKKNMDLNENNQLVGGSMNTQPVSLKMAVQLLKKYYNEKNIGGYNCDSNKDKQKGGYKNPVSLEKAAVLLKQYYNKKYVGGVKNHKQKGGNKNPVSLEKAIDILKQYYNEEDKEKKIHEQKGGNNLNLKSTVKFLREYYNNKYN